MTGAARPQATDRGANLLTLRPRQNLRWETGADGLVVLLVPKFRKGPLARWLTEKLPRPFFRVSLDERGSLFWRSCDGSAAVSEIARKMSETFGEPEEQLYGRIGKFLGQMLRDKFVVLEEEEGKDARSSEDPSSL